jgi:hypothetical protein
MPQRYRLHDSDENLKHRGALLIRPGEDQAAWNRQGWGIFWPVNQFNGPRRIENLTRIEAWAVDMDEGTKPAMSDRLRTAPLWPSLVVETRRGYQAYWRAKDGQPTHWNALVLDRLVPYFGADPNARDLARILRVPGFWHMKDPTQPFKVRTVYANEVAYTEAQLAERFPDVGGRLRAAKAQAQAKREYRDPVAGDSFWDSVGRLDCQEALARLSGHPAVGGERYTFRRTPSGTHNILVDGKTTSCWVDRNGRIGSLANGGPTIAQWLRYFGLTYGDAARVIKQLFPQLEKLR